MNNLVNEINEIISPTRVKLDINDVYNGLSEAMTMLDDIIKYGKVSRELENKLEEIYEQVADADITLRIVTE